MPPTDDYADELRDAVASLRRLASGEDLAAVYPLFVPHNLDVALCFDRGTVAHAWLAANPADDGEAITAAHLESLGLERFGRPGNVPNRFRRDSPDGTGTVTVTHRPAMAGWPEAWVLSGTSPACTISVGFATTRGQLRRLLAALGVPAVLLTSTPHGTEGSQWPTK